MNEGREATLQPVDDLRIGRQRKAAYYLEKIHQSQASRQEFASEIREDFEQMLEELRWSWTCFDKDLLARDICWRYAVITEGICNVLSDGFDAVPVSKSLLIEMCERGIEAAEFLDSELKENVQCALAGRAGQLNLELGQTRRALELFEFSARLAGSTANHQLLVRALTGVADVDFIENRYSNAMGLFINAVRLTKIIGDGPGEAFAIFGAGKSCRALGDGLRAAEYFRNALDRARELNRRDLEAAILQELGDLCLEIRQVDAAIRCFEDGASIQEELGNLFGLCAIRTALGNALLEQNDLEGAQIQFEIAKGDAELISDFISVGRIECGLGVVAKRRGNLDESTKRFQRALDLAQQYSDPEGAHLASKNIQSVLAQNGSTLV